MDQTLANRLQAMPKAEIHIHLMGAIAAEIVYQMAQKNRVRLPATSLEEWKSFYKFRDLAHFVEIYAIASQCIQTPEDYILIVEQFLKHQSEHNIQYSEVHFGTLLHLNKFSDDELIEALTIGARTGETQYGSRVKFIASISRHQPHLQSRALDCALRGQEKGAIVGLGLAGVETGYPPEDFTETFAEAKRQGLRVVAHAGETEGASSVWGALKNLHAERIGHGIRCLEDASLVEELRILQIPLEVSPQSNYCLGVVPRSQPHPIRQMIDAGLYCTLNSDDPPMFNTHLTNEYQTLATQGFSWEELWQLNLNTLEATFLSETEKATYRTQWQEFLQQSSAALT
ncbi:adenosine deaminase [Phormidium sp. CLA17]|uniref:adenosine deaminase n=1 Tax=Leptolyngbya sp. Cla-17 TaxID=2803751 RepID=UPI0014929BC1|nr:adenosine deaminase [Leptolyngbya sp. Cla-17]MBM0741478.1 adenosine deaminase [Leptolyngbya sp. Cla-17]